MKRSFLRPLFALGVAAAGLTACDSVMSAINVFLMKFYDGGGSATLMTPSLTSLFTDIATQELGLGRAARTQNTAEVKRIRAGIAQTINSFVDRNKSKFGVNLAYGLGADNTGNSDKAALPGTAALDLFMLNKSNTPLSALLDPFVVEGGKKDTIDCNFPITLDKIPESSVVDSVIKGKDIPYFLQGTVGYDLKSPTGNVLSSHKSTMDIATKKISTRPSGSDAAKFVQLANEYL